MAQIIEQNGNLVLTLSKLEKVAALPGDIVAKKSDLISQKTIDKPWRSGVLRGFRAPGTGIPFYLLLGTMRYIGGKDFTIIYRNKPVEVFEFKNGPYKRWIISKEK